MLRESAGEVGESLFSLVERNFSGDLFPHLSTKGGRNQAERRELGWEGKGKGERMHAQRT